LNTDSRFMKTTFLTLMVMLVIVSCKRDTPTTNECITYSQSPVTEVAGPKIGMPNQNMIYTVSFGCNSGCAKENTLSETVSGNTRTIAVTTKYVGCVCTMIAPILQTSYTFKTVQTGTYYLKFLQSNNNFIIDTLVIQ